MLKLKSKLLKQWRDFKLLLNNIPPFALAVFLIAGILMNLFANKEIDFGVSWLALDCGILLSWLSFLCMDIITLRFGAKATIKLTVFALVVNLSVSLCLFLVSLIPGNWGAYYLFNSETINVALNKTFGGAWYVVMGSAVAFLASGIVNALVNEGIGKKHKDNSFKTFVKRTYISTLIGQFVDNMVFALIVSHTFFGWSLLQCLTCSVTGCLVELLCEVVFSPIGYKVCKKWEIRNVGMEYLKTNDYTVCKKEDLPG